MTSDGPGRTALTGKTGATGDGRLRYAEVLLKETREEVVRADAKASMLFGVGGVAFGVITAALLSQDGWEPGDLAGYWDKAWWAGAAAALAALVLLGTAVYPRATAGRWFFWVRGARRPSGEGRSDSARYFGDLARCKSCEEAAGLVEAGAETPFDRTVEQAWVISKIVTTKYRLIALALRVLIVAGGLVASATALGEQ